MTATIPQHCAYHTRYHADCRGCRSANRHYVSAADTSPTPTITAEELGFAPDPFPPLSYDPPVAADTTTNDPDPYQGGDTGGGGAGGTFDS